MTDQIRKNGFSLIVEIPSAFQDVSKRFVNGIADFFRSFAWAIRFSRRCENELLGRQFIDAATLDRIVEETENDR